jgi:hypothetical protein
VRLVASSFEPLRLRFTVSKFLLTVSKSLQTVSKSLLVVSKSLLTLRQEVRQSLHLRLQLHHSALEGNCVAMHAPGFAL